MKVLITEEQIQNRIKRMASMIDDHYLYEKQITVIGTLTGSIFFLTDLTRLLHTPLEIEFIKVKSYNGTKQTIPRWDLDLLECDIHSKHILLLDDVLDTGITLHLLISHLQTFFPQSIRVATLLKKPKQKQQVKVDFVGFHIPDIFVYGYGLDNNGLYRNLPYIFFNEEN